MARPRRSGFRTSVGPRRLTQWSEGVQGVNDHTASDTKTLFASAIAFGEPLTIIRMRGELSGFMTVAGTAGDGFREMAVGIGIVSTDAVSVGVTAIPGPLGPDMGWSWIYHRLFSMQNSSTGADGATGSGSFRFEIDSKAMRKVGPNETLVAVSQVTTETGTAGARLTLDTRLLVKLS